MKKSKIFGSILALTLAVVPTVGTIASSNSSVTNSITASAATAGCYRINESTYYWNVYKNNGCNYAQAMQQYGRIPKGALVSSNGREMYCDGWWIRVTYAGITGYVRKTNVTFYAR